MIAFLFGFALACFADDAKANARPVTLVYEIEKPGQLAEQKIDLKRLSHEVENRLDAADIAHAIVKPTSDSQLSVALEDGSPKLVDPRRGRSADLARSNSELQPTSAR